jgi:hypothetical protein
VTGGCRGGSPCPPVDNGFAPMRIRTVQIGVTDACNLAARCARARPPSASGGRAPGMMRPALRQGDRRPRGVGLRHRPALPRLARRVVPPPRPVGFVEPRRRSTSTPFFKWLDQHERRGSTRRREDGSHRPALRPRRATTFVLADAWSDGTHRR